MAISRTQLYYVAGAVVLTVALYFASGDTTENSKEKIGPSDTEHSISFDDRLADAKKSLKRQEVSQLEALEVTSEEHGGKDTSVLGEIGRTWDGFNNPSIAAEYFEQIAQLNPGENEWLNAAFRYFDAFKMTNDSLLRASMVENAIEAYKTVIEINPQNLDAKTDLGLCYAEGTGNPMQGIMLLREVVQAKPDHENAQFNLGVLSVKSGQLDKAVNRFENVLRINPGNYQAEFLLGRCYLKMGQKDKAVASLEKVKSGSKDSQLVEEADNLIHQININQ